MINMNEDEDWINVYCEVHTLLSNECDHKRTRFKPNIYASEL